MAKTPVIPKTPGTEVIDWEKEMEAQARIAAGVVSGIGGNFPKFSIRGGVLSIDDQAVPNNQMAVVVLDSVLENAFYEGDFDPNNISAPTCFAIGRDGPKMAPHETVFAKNQAQHATCQGCPKNEFGSADRGAGKACKNRVRLAVIKAGELDAGGRFTAYTEEDHFASAPAAMFNVPPTSIGGFSTFVKQAASALKTAPHGMFTKVSVRPDPKVQVRVSFEPLQKAPVSLFPVLMKRHDEAKSMVEQPYNLDLESEAPAQAPRGRAAAKKGKY